MLHELEYPFDSEYILKKKKSLLRKLKEQESETLAGKVKIAILGGSTTNDIKICLELFLRQNGIIPEFYESEYNQYYQDAMFENPVLKDFNPDIIYIHTTFRNITLFPELKDDVAKVEEKLTAQYQHFEGMWNQLRSVYNCTIIQNNFEYPSYRLMGNMEQSDIHGKVNFVCRLNMMFNTYAQSHERFLIHDINYLSARFGLDAWSDPFYWYMYKYAMSTKAIPEFSYDLYCMIKSILGKNKKAFSIDLDNTLWGGVVGDDGVENLRLGEETAEGEAYLAFQSYLKEYRQMGILLNVNSKNDEENALAGLMHEAQVLKKDDFIIVKANWMPKNKNLSDMAEELTLLPESIVTLDDNPAEREIIKQTFPLCQAPPLERPENYIRMVDHAGYFEVTSFTKDDLKRTKMYEENAKRAKLQATFTDYTQYLHSLKMKAVIHGFEPVFTSRIAQLTNKSNQFNLTTVRYTQAQIEEMMQSDRYITLYGKLEDCFGDNGVVSVVIGEKEADKLHIRLWLMSCRVLKRNMEQAMLDSLVKEAKEQGITEIFGYYFRTKKNAMVEDFYKTMGFSQISDLDKQDEKVYILSIDGYANQNHVIEIL